MYSSVYRVCATVFPMCIFLACASMNEEPFAQQDGDLDMPLTVKVNSDLVQIPVTVTDRSAQIVENLSKDSFAIFENGVQQTVAHFGASEAPVSLCIIFDTSSSKATKFYRSFDFAARRTKKGCTP